MNINAIKFVLRTCERVADFDLNTLPDYVKVCEIIANFEFRHMIPTYEQRAFVGDTLESLCEGLGLDWHTMATIALQQK
jgi:hypothetical protein